MSHHEQQIKDLQNQVKNLKESHDLLLTRYNLLVAGMTSKNLEGHFQILLADMKKNNLLQRLEKIEQILNQKVV